MTHKAFSRLMFLAASSSFEQPVISRGKGRSVDKERCVFLLIP